MCVLGVLKGKKGGFLGSEKKGRNGTLNEHLIRIFEKFFIGFRLMCYMTKNIFSNILGGYTPPPRPMGVQSATSRPFFFII